MITSKSLKLNYLICGNRSLPKSTGVVQHSVLSSIICMWFSPMYKTTAEKMERVGQTNCSTYSRTWISMYLHQHNTKDRELWRRCLHSWNSSGPFALLAAVHLIAQAIVCIFALQQSVVRAALQVPVIVIGFYTTYYLGVWNSHAKNKWNFVHSPNQYVIESERCTNVW